jgi:hypothetical protein
MHAEIPPIFFEEHTVPDDDWANTPPSVQRAFEWLWRERERLRAQAEQSSRNSSIPSSNNRPQHQRPRSAKATGRKPGGQPGHPGVTRPLVPVEQLSALPVAVLPETCPCGHHFPAEAPITDDPYRHQQYELPPLAPIIIEVQLHHRACPDCGAEVRAEVAPLLCEGHHADPRTKTTCHSLRQLEPALWTFLRVEGVEATNNPAERSQRRGVCKRERTFGTQTSAGSRYVERILTTTATCRQQGTDTLRYLTEALLASLRGGPAPALAQP